jgi:hypothetical protein
LRNESEVQNFLKLSRFQYTLDYFRIAPTLTFANLGMNDLDIFFLHDNQHRQITTFGSIFVKMGRLHSNGKGISASAIPYSRTPPAWLKTTPEQVVDQICKLAKKGATPSQIGVVLRDSHGIAQVKVVTGMLVLEHA